MDEESYKICHSFQFFTAFSSLAAAAAISQSCDKTLKGREAEQNPWQSDKGVGQELNALRIDDATRRGELVLNIGRAFIHSSTLRYIPGKAEISPGVKKSEEEAKDEGLNEAAGSPVQSPLFQFSPQGSNLEAIAPIEVLK